MSNVELISIRIVLVTSNLELVHMTVSRNIMAIDVTDNVLTHAWGNYVTVQVIVSVVVWTVITEKTVE